jgi:hypothetical protein
MFVLGTNLLKTPCGVTPPPPHFGAWQNVICRGKVCPQLSGRLVDLICSCLILSDLYTKNNSKSIKHRSKINKKSITNRSEIGQNGVQGRLRRDVGKGCSVDRFWKQPFPTSLLKRPWTPFWPISDRFVIDFLLIFKPPNLDFCTPLQRFKQFFQNCKFTLTCPLEVDFGAQNH